ncbi:MAG: ABC transporter ATP-binding protein [Alphaproteobacteria bacterium]|nr:ABC transporter ATP-binding protein [Alphaproteobacteria bacterium]MCB9974641.1 ABC transporter ATP-binding protein [Rhodospirillales bacterium]
MSEVSSVLIETRNLTRILPLEVPVTLVEDVSLSIDAGQFVSITGPSGSGKSSLLYLLGLLDQPSEGQVFIDGQDVTKLSSQDLCRIRLKKLGFVFQFHFLLSEFTILENVRVPMRKLAKWPEKEQIERAEKILEDLGMEDHLHKHPFQLSGGQRQRVAVARAVANEPLVVLADEPTGNLDTKNSDIVRDIFRDLVRTHRTTVVMVTHDLELAAQTDRRVHLVDGRVVS